MKEDYLKLLRKLKKEVKATDNCKEKDLMLLGIDNFIKTIKSDEITDEDLKEYLLRELNKEREVKLWTTIIKCL